MPHICRDNEPMSSVTHLVGAGLAIAALVLLVVFAAINGTASHVVGASVFGASMVLLYLTSGLYHLVSKQHPAKPLLQRLDHAMIYVLIAGTYTPLTLVLAHTHQGWGWSLFGINWGIAALGIALKTKNIHVPTWILVILYLLMGWMIALPWTLLHELLGDSGMFWLILGGTSYTLGALAFALDTVVPRTRWFGMHEIFHLLVLAGSFAHFWTVLFYL